MSIVHNMQGKTAGFLVCVSLSLYLLEFFTLPNNVGFICALFTNWLCLRIFFEAMKRNRPLGESIKFIWKCVNVSFSVVAYSPFQLYFIQIHCLNVNEMQWHFWKSNSHHRYCLKPRPLERGVRETVSCIVMAGWLHNV